MLTWLVPILAIGAGAQPAAAPVAPAATARAERAATGGEMLQRASADLARIRRALREVLERIEDARHEKDLVKLLCLDDKLAQAKQLVAVAERAETALAEAVANRDDGAVVESSKIGIARGKVDAIRADAAACIGQLAYEVEGRTSVFVEEAEDLPEGGAGSRTVDPTREPDPYRHAFGIPSAGLR
jgi:hypothetical protein